MEELEVITTVMMMMISRNTTMTKILETKEAMT